MRIVLVTDQYDNLNNGTTATARRYAQELRMRGHKVTVLASGMPEKDKINVDELKIPLFQPLIQKQGFCFAKAKDEAYYQAFRNADIIHFFLPSWFCRRGEEIARQMKIPTIAAFHLQPENVTYSLGLGKNRRINTVIYKYFYRTFYSRFRYIHCPSQMIADQLEKQEYNAECCVISNGVSNQFVPKVVERQAALRNKFVILMIGRLSGEKRQDLIIQAAQKSKYSKQIQLVFAGRGPKENIYRKLGKKLPNPPIFGFYSQDDLIGLINTSDLYVHASDAEIEGISCMEAMACGLVPVISDSELSATKSFSLHAKSLFRAGNAESLAQQIDYWIEHPQERLELGKCYAQKADQIRVCHCVSEMEKLYQKAIDDFLRLGYASPVESHLRRAMHPNADRVNLSYFNMSLVKRWWFFSYTNFLTLVLYFIDSVFFGLKIEGRKQLKKVKGGAVTVVNHVHPMDCTMVKLAVYPRLILFTSLRRNLELPLIGWLIKVLGGLPLPTDSEEMVSFQRYLRRGLRRGDWVNYYPEGLLIQDYQDLRSFHKGAFFTAVNSDCPIVPMVIAHLQPRGLWRLAIGKKQMRLFIGEPQYPDISLSRKDAVKELSDRTYEIMQRMMNEPICAEIWSVSVAVRLSCILFIVIQAIKFFGF